MLRDLRYAIRNLRNRPTVTIAAIASLAIGIGANTALFSVWNAALLRPLGIRDPGRVFALGYQTGLPQGTLAEFDFPAFRAMRDESAPQLGLAGFEYEPVDIATEAGVASAQGALVTGNYFRLLGVQPILGRDFAPEEDRASGAPAVAVISEGLWRSRFHADVTTPGRTLRINGHPFTIVGVIPAAFTGTVMGSAPDVWVATAMWRDVLRLPGGFAANFDALQRGSLFWIQPLVRLGPGITPETARALLGRIVRQEAPVDAVGRPPQIEMSSVEVSRLPREYSGSAALMMKALFAIVGLLLLIACANTASLLMGRALSRRKEIAIRIALGARRGQVVSSLMTESGVIAAAGAALGVLMALWIAAGIEAWRPLMNVPIPVHIGIDARVLAFTALIAALSGVAVGLGTGLHATRGYASAGLNEISASSVSRTRWLSARDWLVAGQLALSLGLLVSAGLLLRTLANLESIDVGFNLRNLIVVEANLLQHDYSEAAAMRAYPQLLDRLRRIPGIESAALAEYVPLSSSRSSWMFGEEAQKVIYLEQNSVSPEYFHTLGVSLVAGREFTDFDREGSQPVSIVNEAMVRLMMKTANPLGKSVPEAGSKGVVVGVVRDNKTNSLRQHTEPWSYVPYAQAPQPRMSVLIRARGDALPMLPAVLHAAREIDSSLPDSSVTLMADKLRAILWQPRATTVLAGCFAGLAALLAMVGVYGTVSFHVSQRIRDVGIRMAFGASRGDILKLIVGRGAAIALIGVLIGEAAAITLSRLLSALLYGVRPTDPLVLIAAPALLIAVAAFSSFLPARRALRSDPVTVLRYQ